MKNEKRYKLELLNEAGAWEVCDEIPADDQREYIEDLVRQNEREGRPARVAEFELVRVVSETETVTTSDGRVGALGGAPLPAAGPWISVEERMPDTMTPVLVATQADGHHVAQWVDHDGTDAPGYWIASDGDTLERVRWWAEIVPPKESE